MGVVKPTEHGEIRMYARGCRCDLCRAAKSVENSKRDRRTKNFKHGTTRGYRTYGCRCEPCSEINSEKKTESRKKRHADFAAGKIPDVPHGLENTYNSYGCRCDPCVEAHALVGKTLRDKNKPEQLKIKVPRQPNHGTISEYNHWGCRCRPCTDAAVARDRENAAKRRAAQGKKRVKPRKGEFLTHGNHSSYLRGCRCTKCILGERQYWRDHRIEGRRKFANGEITDINHGTTTAYTKYGCRCDKCVQHNREASLRYKTPQSKGKIDSPQGMTTLADKLEAMLRDQRRSSASAAADSESSSGNSRR